MNHICTTFSLSGSNIPQSSRRINPYITIFFNKCSNHTNRLLMNDFTHCNVANTMFTVPATKCSCILTRFACVQMCSHQPDCSVSVHHNATSFATSLLEDGRVVVGHTTSPDSIPNQLCFSEKCIMTSQQHDTCS